MSLLTEEQVKEIIDIHYTTDTEFAHKLRVWNAKQTATQFEPDWSKAPECAAGAVLKFYWVGEGSWTFGQTIVEYQKPKPVIKPHPHSEILKKYAEVAARRTDPWAEFEIFGADDEQWVASKSHLQFRACCKYRYIGDGK
jgi:hypothetical protein